MSEAQYLVRFGPSANCTFELCSIEETAYRYRPSLPANIVFAAIFSLATIVHVILGLRWKTPWVMWCMILSCTHEVAGYVARVVLWVNPWNFGAFITQIICITQAPVFYCAAIYVMLGQCINFYAPTLARFDTKYFVWIFLPCDIISLILQGVGGGMSAASSGDDTNGEKIAMAGLIFQVITLGAFSILFGDFIVRLLGSAHAKSLIRRDTLFLGFLVGAILSTLARCIFRAYELKEGYKGDLITHEDLFIGLEGVLVVVAVFCLCIGHPGFVFKGRKGKEDYKNVPTTHEHVVLMENAKTAYLGA
ncbi:RTA1-domain-containing protein [Phaeosphaeriaceae sp. SRC1lsM3a]|nr:RTA1-domain-containing protein [Stagonospora sp. SRC1lsM3a]